MWAIKYKGSGFFDCWTGIGPKFGATEKSCAKYRIKRDAQLEMSSHFAFIMCDVVKVRANNAKESANAS